MPSDFLFAIRRTIETHVSRMTIALERNVFIMHSFGTSYSRLILNFRGPFGSLTIGKMQIVVRKELKSPVSEKREICLKSSNGAKSRIA